MKIKISRLEDGVPLNSQKVFQRLPGVVRSTFGALKSVPKQTRELLFSCRKQSFGSYIGRALIFYLGSKLMEKNNSRLEDCVPLNSQKKLQRLA